MVVWRVVQGIERYLVGASGTGEGCVWQPGTLAGSHHHTTIEIGQHERGLAIAAESVADHRKQHAVLLDQQRTPVAGKKILRHETVGQKPDFTIESVHGMLFP
ncbi:hypothetical protein NWF32_24365 [Pseudomonas qingdaonensis]|nr:hypothetical protein [Pseudomonas qingdaonensis]